VVPERAVFLQHDGSYVYRAKNGKAELVKVTLGERRVGEVEVLEGLAATDDIITDGQIKLRPDAPVTLLSKPNTPSGQNPAANPEEKKPEEPKPSATAPASKPENKVEKMEPPANAAREPFIPAPAETNTPAAGGKKE
jgi:hypothetical protein